MSVPSIANRILQVPRGRHSASLETSRPISAEVTFTVPAGAVGYLNASKEWETGLPDVNDKGYVPLVLFQQSDDPDVRLPSSMDPSSDAMAYVSGVDTGLDANGNAAPKGPLMLIGLAPFIIESRHFQSEDSLGSSYEPGDTLTATNANTNAVTGGRLTKGTIKSVPVCGVVYEGVKSNLEGTSLLSWISWFFPALS